MIVLLPSSDTLVLLPSYDSMLNFEIIKSVGLTQPQKPACEVRIVQGLYTTNFYCTHVSTVASKIMTAEQF